MIDWEKNAISYINDGDAGGGGGALCAVRGK